MMLSLRTSNISEHLQTTTDGTIPDTFLAERPMRDWARMLVEQILHAIVVRQETGSVVTIMSSLRKSASALRVAGSASRLSLSLPRSPLSCEGRVLSSPSKQIPSPMKSSAHPSSSQTPSSVKAQPISPPDLPLSPVSSAVPPPNITQVHLVGQNLRGSWLANEIAMGLIPPPGAAWCSGKLVRVSHYVAATPRNQRRQAWRT